MSGTSPSAADPAAVPAQFQSFLAFDFGLKRTGVAVGSRLLGQANPLPTIRTDAKEARLQQAGERIREWQPHALVVGVPYHPDGAAHENTVRARNLVASCMRASVCRCTRWTSATAPPRPWRAARAMPTPPRPASSWNSF